MLPARDPELVQIVDRALADATARGAAHLACRPGCTPCCHGVFRISQLDAARLRAGLELLSQVAPQRAGAVKQRAQAYVESLASSYPGDSETGLLHMEDEDWDRFADQPQADLPCPVLDPATGRCELYAHRPLTCRIFGPPVRSREGIGICELCYQSASEAEVLAGEMHLAHEPLEEALDAEMAASGLAGQTVIAWALLAPSI